MFTIILSFGYFILFLYSKLGVPIKTTISANVLEEALNGTVTVRPLPIGTSVSGKVILALCQSATVQILVCRSYFFFFSPAGGETMCPLFWCNDQ